MNESDEKLRQLIAENIAYYRKLNGDTQAGLAEKLSYSDKSVSKWERGEAIPDAAVLKRMSEIFGVTVDYLLNEHDAWQPGPEPAACDRSHHAIILVALMGIVTLAVLVFVVLGGIGNIRGSVIAAVILTLLPELLRGLNNYRMLIYAIVLIAMMIFNWSPAIIDFRKRHSFRQMFGKKKTAKEVQ